MFEKSYSQCPSPVFLFYNLIKGDFFCRLFFLLFFLCISSICWIASSRPLRKEFPYSELFWFVFSRIRAEEGEIRSISPYSVRMQESTDHNNSEWDTFHAVIIKYCEIGKSENTDWCICHVTYLY